MKKLRIACAEKEIGTGAAVVQAIQMWMAPPGQAGAPADPHEVTRTGPDQEAADALLAWWNSPEEDHVQAHLKRAIAAMLQIEHLLPGFLKGKKK
jgi:hypothetical protein